MPSILCRNRKQDRNRGQLVSNEAAKMEANRERHRRKRHQPRSLMRDRSESFSDGDSELKGMGDRQNLGLSYGCRKLKFMPTRVDRTYRETWRDFDSACAVRDGFKRDEMAAVDVCSHITFQQRDGKNKRKGTRSHYWYIYGNFKVSRLTAYILRQAVDSDLARTRSSDGLSISDWVVRGYGNK
ncbi:hypothetical protein BaRGS_00018018, partial [Batillaria attramentaria]